MNEMRGKSLLTVGGALVLEKIMRSCPPIASNGGMAMKKYLAKKSKEVEKRNYFFEITKKFHSLRRVVSPYDVYADLENYLGEREANFWNIVDFFAGLPHIEQAVRERDSKEIAMLNEMVKEKYFFAHVLLPILLTDNRDNLFDGVYCNGKICVEIKNLRVFSEDKKRFSVGMTVLAHYSCIIDEIDEKAKERLLGLQRKSKRFIKACKNISEVGVNHADMAYDPWCERVSG